MRILIRNITCSVVVILFAIHFVSAQFTYEKPEYENRVRGVIIKSNPAVLLWGPIIYTSEFRIGADLPVARNQVVFASISYLAKNPIISLMEKTDTLTGPNNVRYTVSGFRLQLGYKLIFLSFNARNRFYISPHVSFSVAKISTRAYKNTDVYILARYSSYSLLFGYQTPIFTKRMDLDLFFGFGYRDNHWYEHMNQTYKPYDDSGIYTYNGPLKITFGFNLGIVID